MVTATASLARRNQDFRARVVTDALIGPQFLR